MKAESAIPVRLNTNGPVPLDVEESGISTIGAQQQLGQEDFLQLLVTQMSNQDPLNPQADMDYFTQMAQFASLEQNKELGVTMQRIEASSLIGKTVELQNQNGELSTGVVEAVLISAGKPKVVVDGGSYELSEVVNVLTTQTNASQSMMAEPSHKSAKK